MMFLTFVTASVQFSCENPHIVMFLQLLPEPENPFKSCSDGEACHVNSIPWISIFLVIKLYEILGRLDPLSSR